ncbi:MAG: hypothetical protein C4287_02465 [Leptolyngbya sp. ERB_1_2]
MSCPVGILFGVGVGGLLGVGVGEAEQFEQKGKRIPHRSERWYKSILVLKRRLVQFQLDLLLAVRGFAAPLAVFQAVQA